MTFDWGAAWAWSLLLVSLTVTLHAVGVVTIAVVLARLGSQIATCHWTSWRAGLLAVAIIGAVGLVLTALHGAEAGIWAALYVWLGALGSWRDAMLYSVDSLTTRGASGLHLEASWQMMGALESANGMMLFGISTAFLFAVLDQAWRLLAASRYRQG